MNVLEEVYIQCPYCAEQISVLVDCSVCCQPIVLDVCVNECNNVLLEARREND